MITSSAFSRRRKQKAGSDKEDNGPGSKKILAYSTVSNGEAKNSSEKPAKRASRFNLARIFIWARRKQHSRIFVGVSLLLLFWITQVRFHDALWGDGYSLDGGMFGSWFDQVTLTLQTKHSHPPIKHLNITYPLVTTRNSREKFSVYSRFLEVILGLELWKQQHYKSIMPRLNESPQPGISNFPSPLDPNGVRTSAWYVFRENQCRPGWICHRCMAFHENRDPKYFCQSVCPSCYLDLLCSHIHQSRYLYGNNRSLLNTTRSNNDEPRIPRIIHQVGPAEWLDPARFPQLVRLQNSWRQQQQQHPGHYGATTQYRYYTPDLASRFVRKYFASFLADYLALSELEKRTVFGWMALYQIGGVVASMELLLEANLHHAVFDSGYSFVAAVLFPTSSSPDNGDCFFLWHGFLAAHPQHPVLGMAIRLFFEAKNKSPPDNTAGALRISRLWETASRSCADHRPSQKFCWRHPGFEKHFESYLLGKAFQDVYERNSGGALEDDYIKHFTSSKDKSILLLLMSPHDTGATRLTDIQRNLLVASTDLLGLSLHSVTSARTLRSANG